MNNNYLRKTQRLLNIFIILFGLFFFLLVWLGFTNHFHFHSDGILIFNEDQTVGMSYDYYTELTRNKSFSRADILSELRQNKVLLTPNEFTSNVVNYYNDLICFLIFLFGLFTFFSFIQFKYQIQSEANKFLEEVTQDEDFREKLKDDAILSLEDNFAVLQDQVTTDLMFEIIGSDDFSSAIEEIASSYLENNSNNDNNQILE